MLFSNNESTNPVGFLVSCDPKSERVITQELFPLLTEVLEELYPSPANLSGSSLAAQEAGESGESSNANEVPETPNVPRFVEKKTRNPSPEHLRRVQVYDTG